MKKVLSMAIALLAISAAFVGCVEPNPNGGEGENAVTAIEINPSEITLLIDDEPLRLSVKTTPEGVKVDLDWTSSDETVATVQDGKVIPQGSGEALITATVKGTEISAACKVSVKSLEENLTFTECYLGLSAIDEDSLYTFEHSQLGTIHAHIALAGVRLFSEGFYFNASGQLDGAKQGGLIYFTAPVALAYAKDNTDNPNMAAYTNGVSFSLGNYGIANYEGVSTKTISMTDYQDQPVEVEILVDETGAPAVHCALPTVVDDALYISKISEFLAAFNSTGEITQESFDVFCEAGLEGITGPELYLLQYETSEEGESGYNSYPNWLWQAFPNAIVLGGELYVGGEDGSSEFMTLLDYVNIDVQFLQSDTIGFPGVYTSFDNQTGYSLLSNKVELGEVVNYTRGQMPAEKIARQHKGLNIFVDHALTFENAPMFPVKNEKNFRIKK